MRIGNTLIDTDHMSAKEMSSLIDALTTIRERKERMEALRAKMNRLIEQAKDDGFTFVDNSCGFIREVDDFHMYDERM